MADPEENGPGRLCDLERRRAGAIAPASRHYLGNHQGEPSCPVNPRKRREEKRGAAPGAGGDTRKRRAAPPATPPEPVSAANEHPAAPDPSAGAAEAPRPPAPVVKVDLAELQRMTGSAGMSSGSS